MNYFKLIGAFYDSQLLNPLSTGQIALWNALAFINNKCTWVEWFTVANQTLELMTGLNKSTIVRHRNLLKQQGLIDFKLGNGGKACKYKIIDITVLDNASSYATINAPINATRSATDMQQVCDEVCNNLATSMQPLNNITKTKLNNKKENIKRKKQPQSDMVDEYTQNENLRQALKDFIDMRKTIKKPLTDRALTQILSKLDDLSISDEYKIKSLEQSIEKCYLSVFDVKQNNYNNSYNNYNNVNTTPTQASNKELKAKSLMDIVNENNAKKEYGEVDLNGII